jgi:ribosomal protein S18 acetylase RimI-like enzyme
VAVKESAITAFAAGHLTTRHGCDGELQWINVVPAFRGTGVGSALLRVLARWFVEQEAFRICVDVDPTNTAARDFYIRNGAEELGKHWMVWDDIAAILQAREPRQ